MNEQIKVLCNRENISVSELARRLGKSPQNLTQQLNRGNLRIEDIEKISNIIGYSFVYDFVKSDG